ncbi:MaoC family dehydratase N-terminal domain-containing protein [Thalassotalea psychrophila]|uniref:MaoC family dehydratase N-terminal domain-containing protein n=1 Tax=Thalassotalea psychrophila TaxID=3065647 RepID=A0ABY9TYB3_9GAMM|nr:MaoC family dehydratase N-terminal domain-containing protein [Colwelliaceae bacterium SQ149]
MLDQSKIGHKFPTFKIDVEKGRLKMFAKAIGETNPIYSDESAAIEAGYKTIPAPPTFPFTIELDGPELLPVLRVLNMDIGKLLHGSQDFEYFDTIYAGDCIEVNCVIVNMFSKKGGALEFVELESSYSNQNAKLVAKATCTLVYRNA